MKELKEYYNARKNLFLKLCIPGWIALELCIQFISNSSIIQCFYEGLKQHISNLFILSVENKIIIKYLANMIFGFIAPTSIVYMAYNRGLNYINKKGWKKKFPQYDISGEWEDKTVYIKKLDKNGWEIIHPITVPSPVIIKQDCLTISIQVSVGDDFVWHSLLSDWTEHNVLEIFYKVEYKSDLQKQGYPEQRLGYECMSICSFDKSKQKKPNKLSGKFWHCIANDNRPMYMGDVQYERK